MPPCTPEPTHHTGFSDFEPTHLDSLILPTKNWLSMHEHVEMHILSKNSPDQALQTKHGGRGQERQCAVWVGRSAHGKQPPKPRSGETASLGPGPSPRIGNTHLRTKHKECARMQSTQTQGSQRTCLAPSLVHPAAGFRHAFNEPRDSLHRTHRKCDHDARARAPHPNRLIRTSHPNRPIRTRRSCCALSSNRRIGYCSAVEQPLPCFIEEPCTLSRPILSRPIKFEQPRRVFTRIRAQWIICIWLLEQLQQGSQYMLEMRGLGGIGWRWTQSSVR